MKYNKNLILSTLAGLFFSGAALADPVTIWAWDPNFNIKVLDKAVEIFKKNNPKSEFNIVDFSKDEIEQKLHTMLASGFTKELPDIVLIDDYNAKKYLGAYPGSFAELTNDFDYTKFSQFKVNIMTEGEKVFGVPFDVGVTGLFYRTDLLAKSGFSAKDVENITWTRFIEIAKKVKAETGKPMMTVDPNDLSIVRIMMQTAGGWYFNKDGSLNLKDNAPLNKSLTVYKELLKSGTTKKTAGWSDFVGNFNRGDVASVTTGIWITNSVKSEASQSGKWAIAPTPRIDLPEAVNASNLGGSSWYVPSTSEEKTEAIDFLKATFGTNKNFYGSILTEIGAMGSYLPASSTAAYNYEEPYFADQAIYSDFSQWNKSVPVVNYGMHTYEVESVLAAAIPQIIEAEDMSKILSDVQRQLEFNLQ